MGSYYSEANPQALTFKQRVAEIQAGNAGNGGNGEPGAIAKLLEENPIAFAIGAAVLAYVAVRALK